jgi:hypothetical protein
MSTHPLLRRACVTPLAAALVLAACGKGEHRGSANAAGGAGGGASRQIADVGLRGPETVLWDSLSDLYLVSNVNGDPGAKDGNGFISRIGPDGRVVALKWIAGGAAGAALNAPKGMAILGDSLFVADLDAVRVFDRRTGAPLRAIAIAGASGLNGMTVGPDGRVWVTDLASGAIYRIEGTNAAAVAPPGSATAQPNGIAPLGQGVAVATFGGDEVYRLDAAGRRTPLAKLPAGGLDGLLRLPDGSLAVTSWKSNAVYRIDPAGQVTTLVADAKSPAQIGYDAKRHRLLVPLFEKDAIALHDLP